MVASSTASVVVGEHAPSTGLVDTPATPGSVVAYLESGQRMRQLTDLVLKVCVTVVVLVALAWALGVLPGAVKLF